ncbi:MAG: arginine--tRNA ligase [Syntrophomonadaceae bacterium]|jgi:arginyl-tRNA synthetase|nr:arginine--tRNA ligase [Syntrophomonadaceae bacterium]
MNLVKQMEEGLRRWVETALAQAREKGELSYQEVPSFVIEVPREKQHGDFACNVAMLLARQARMAPARIANIIVSNLDKNDALIEGVEVAGAGFINFFLRPDWLYDVPRVVWEAGENYGQELANGQKIQVEFVSANPTGDLHMGNARGGAIGDSLANILSLAGYEVEREYYINDAGNQIELFGLSLEARYLELCGREFQFPEAGYAGEDVVETVQRFIAEHGDSLVSAEAEARIRALTGYALQEKIAYIKTTLEQFGITYDVWFKESSLHQSGKLSEVIRELKDAGCLYEEDGAWWFKAGVEEGEAKDEVVIRNNGTPTYFAADIAYHQNKFERGFDQVINVWGADHHGHVARMKAAVAALGYDPDRLEVLLMQLVRLYRGGEMVRMSKRTGTLVTLNELIEEVGRDAARFFFVMRSADSHLDFDLELAKQESQENPVYYVQYAHARICSILRQAQASGIEIKSPDQVDVRRLAADEELALLRKVADFPNEILTAAETMGPHRIARYVLELAGMFHSYYNHYRVLNEEAELRDARLILMEIIRRTIKKALNILGVSAPERM